MHTVGLLTCGNITTEVSCGCDDIICLEAVGFPIAAVSQKKN